MAQKFSPRSRRVKVLATLGPASASLDMIRVLTLAGADAFRINMSHGTPDARAALIANIRALEAEIGRPLTVLADLRRSDNASHDVQNQPSGQSSPGSTSPA